MKRSIKIWTPELDELAERQLREVASLPVTYKHMAVKSDTHASKGSTISTVIATEGAFLLPAVGVHL